MISSFGIYDFFFDVVFFFFGWFVGINHWISRQCTETSSAESQFGERFLVFGACSMLVSKGNDKYTLEIVHMNAFYMLKLHI